MNAELDATIGPILQTYADKYGVILSACEATSRIANEPYAGLLVSA
jgi:predicted homoserine dehydrogenase-like protein